MGRIVALDSSVVITLAGGQSRHADGAERAQQLLAAHRDAGDTVIIPAPAFAECCHAPHEIVRQLRVESLTAVAAILANRITRRFVKTGKAYPAKPTRQALKLDACILAVAETVQAEILYTEDQWFLQVARAEQMRVQIRDLPPREQVQASLPLSPVEGGEEPPAEEASGEDG